MLSPQFKDAGTKVATVLFSSFPDNLKVAAVVQVIICVFHTEIKRKAWHLSGKQTFS